MAKHEIEMIVTGNHSHGGSGGMYGQQSSNPWGQGGNYGMGFMGAMGMGTMGYYGQMMNMNQQFQAAYGWVNCAKLIIPLSIGANNWCIISIYQLHSQANPKKGSIVSCGWWVEWGASPCDCGMLVHSPKKTTGFTCCSGARPFDLQSPGPL